MKAITLKKELLMTDVLSNPIFGMRRRRASVWQRTCTGEQRCDASKRVAARQKGRKGAGGTKGATRWLGGSVAAGRE